VLIEIALTNLLENALKYGADPIEISARIQSGELVVEVTDRGPGIPASEVSRVFEKFHRAGRDASPGGVGLGLAICRAVIAAHGGRIWARNREQGGAAFCFTLPIDGEPPRLAAREAPFGDAGS
jgi:two-component system sensor histidine kinase KdpD